MIRLSIGLILGALATMMAYESTNLLETTRSLLDTKLEKSYPKITEKLASLSKTGIPIAFEEIIPSIRSLSQSFLTQEKTISPAGSGYYVQVGAFTEAEDGAQMRASLLLKGFLKEHIFVESAPNQELHRVLIGPYQDKGKALLSLSWAHKQEFDALVIKRS